MSYLIDQLLPTLYVPGPMFVKVLARMLEIEWAEIRGLADC